ncbi:MAG TPA: ABC transporter permease [Gemmatimonadaceae bacterium]|nr:ABC transporter permease [Gemmatimonadaceae bacterium]
MQRRVLRRGRALRSAIWKERVNDEVDAELRFHLESLIQRYVEHGMTPAEAHTMALRKFGNVDQVTQRCRVIGEGRERRMRWTEWLADLRQDLGFAVRQFGRARGFTVTAILTLTLGLGATTAIFSVVDGVLLQPLPLTEPDRVVHVYNGVYAGDIGGPQSALNFLDWRAQNHSFAQMAAEAAVTANLTGGCASHSGACEPQRLRGMAVTANFFATLGAHPALGRLFAPGEDQPGAPRVTILSHGLWQSRFGADSDLVGRTIMLNGQRTTVVGVAQPGMPLPDQAEVWIPLVFSPTDLTEPARGNYVLTVFARLKPGVAVTTAQRDVAAISERLIHRYPTENPTLTRPIRLVDLRTDVVGDVRTPLFVLLGAVTLVLLIACANVANLLLLRATGRGTEIAVRTALGASRWRIVRQLLTESVALSTVAGALGTLLAWCSVRVLIALGPASIPRLDDVHLDARVLAFTAAMVALTGVGFGLAPALAATRSSLAESLREGARGARGSAGNPRLKSALVVAEFAFSLMLLAGAGLLIKSFHRLMTVDLGFRPAHVMTFTLDLPSTAYPTDDAIRTFVSATTNRLQQLPGVQSAALAFGMAEKGVGNDFTIDGRAATPSAPLIAFMPSVTSGFVRAMRIPLIAGRVFTPADRHGSAPVAMLNQAAATRFFAGESPVGHTLRIDGLDDSLAPPRQIVGVVGDTRTMLGPTEPAPPQIYVPLEQSPARYLIAVIRTAGAPASVMPAARAAVHDVDPTLPISHAWTMDQRTAQFVRQPRFYMLLLGLFASVALVLAAVGIYGVMSYAVTQRQHELGIRVALGATPGGLLRRVIAQGAALSAIGLVAGLAAAAGLSHLIASLLFEVTPTDIATYVTVSVLLTIIALLACIIPARRAARVDPAIALRGE